MHRRARVRRCDRERVCVSAYVPNRNDNEPSILRDLFCDDTAIVTFLVCLFEYQGAQDGTK